MCLLRPCYLYQSRTQEAEKGPMTDNTEKGRGQRAGAGWGVGGVEVEIKGSEENKKE